MIVANTGVPVEMESVDSSLSNQTIADLETTRVVIFMGDDISSNEKYEMPSVRGFGGIFMGHIKTLPKVNKGMLYRCTLTALRPAKITQPFTMLPPAARDSWDKGFSQSNAVRNADGTWSDKIVDGFMTSDPQATREGEFKLKKSTHQGYKTVYPGNDVQQIVKRSLPHGAGGIVEVTALKGASATDIFAAQLFFFPNWNETRKGNPKFALPTTIRETEDHIKARIAAIQIECPVEKQNQYRQIGAEMLRSCDEFRVAYLSTFQKNETILKDSAAKGNTGVHYPQRAEEAMTMLEYKRKDDLVSGESSSVDRLARIMEKNESANAETESRRMLLEERKQYLAEVQAGMRERDEEEEIRLGMRTAKPHTVEAPTIVTVVDTPIVASEVVNVSEADMTFVPLLADTDGTPDGPVSNLTATGEQATSPQIDSLTRIECGKPKSNGELCTRTVEGGGGCFQHPDE